MRLLLVRHGQTSSNVHHLLDTAAPGAGLTPLGLEQATALVDAVSGERVDAVVASPLLRTRQTAAPLARARGLQTVLHPGVREIAAGDLEMRGDREAGEAYLATMVAWASGDLERRGPLGESGEAFFARYDGAVADVVASVRAMAGEDATAVVVTHGAAMRLWVASRARNVDVARVSRPMANTGVVVLAGDGTSWDVETWDGAPVGGEDLAEPGTQAQGPGGEPFPM